MLFVFPRSLRLLKKPSYDYVFQAANSIRANFSTVLYRKSSLDYPRLGLIVSKKTGKHAHDRNRFKRIVRESFRLAQHQLPAVDIVVLSKGKINVVDNQALWAEFIRVWQKMQE